MNVSVFRNFIKVRDELGAIAYSNNNCIANLTNASTIQGNSLNVDGITAKFDDGKMSIKSYSGTTTTVNISELYDKLDDYIPGTSLTYGDYFNSASNCGDLYAQLSAITSKFSYSSRMTLTDLNGVIDSVRVNSTNYDVSDLKSQLVAVSDNEGYVSGRNWLICLQNWLNAAKHASDSNSPSLDTTNAFTLAGIYNVIVNVISTVLSAICTALSGVFRVVLTIVGSIISTLFNALSTYFSSETTLDWNATNSFVKGPICATVMYPHWYSGFPAYSVFGNTYKIMYSECNGIGTFLWRVKKDTYQGMNVNSYLYPCYNYKAVARWLQSAMDNSYITDQDNIYRIVIYQTFYNNSPGVPENSESEAAEICISSESVETALCVDAFVRFLLSMSTFHHDDGYWWALGSYAGSTSHGSGSFMKAYCNIAEVGLKIVMGWLKHSDPYHWATRSMVQSVIKTYVQYMNSDMANPLRENYEAFTNAMGTQAIVPGAYICVGNEEQVTGFYQSMTYNSTTEQYVFTTVWHDGLDERFNLYEVNTVPTGNYFITLKSVTLSEVLSVLAVGLVVATASAVVYTLSSRALALKKTQKSTLRVADINNKREAFLADPTNKQKGTEYAKAVAKYNRLGRLLGWGTYDGVNNWVDAPDGSGDSNIVSGLKALWTTTDSVDGSTNTISSKICASSSSSYNVETATNELKTLLLRVLALIK